MEHSDAAGYRDSQRSVQMDRLAMAMSCIRDVQGRLMDKTILGAEDILDIQHAIDHLQSLVDSLKT